MLVSQLVQVTFSVPEAAAEAVANLLAEEGSGIELRDGETLARTENGRRELLVWLPEAVVESRVERVETLVRSLGEIGIQAEPWSWRSERVSDEDWKEAYKDHFDVTRLGRLIVVKPSWREFEPGPADRVIELDPGMAFGTGLHASTALVVQALERLAARGAPPKKVLDIGTGTGILALAAARLWPQCRVNAIDSDETAVAVCRQNVERNRMTRHVTVEHRSAADVEGHFNLVVANLTRELLLEIRPKMRPVLTDGGHLVVSGILGADGAEVAHAYSRDLGLEPEFSTARDEWVAIMFRARG